ncbi:MAG: hypothetical protein G01um101433_1003 [Parcubacteria group bacterium Gr01-1014_33]|nr:MAG: hypothetical protein G01um101433_1003 [Parcubacteria group bacterium Gr01-1014_33]
MAAALFAVWGGDKIPVEILVMGFIFLGILAAGFLIFGWYVSGISKKVQKLFGGKSGEGDIQSNVLERLMKAEAKIEEMEPHLARVEKVSKVSIHKVGFLRFNPFQDTGGDNSFALALLDSENNGVLISSFYAREGTRVYAKQIIGGHTRHPLSAEEKKVLEETIQELN